MDAARTEYLKRTAARMLDVTLSGFVVDRAWAAASTARPGAQRPRSWCHPGIHAGPVPEMCVVLDGRPVMVIEDECVPLPAGAVAVLRPGIRHCEGTTEPDAPHTSFWVSASRGSMHAHAVHYRPETGWDSIPRYSLQTSSARALHERLTSSPEPPSSALLETIRAAALVILGALMAAEAARPAPREQLPERLRSRRDALEHVRAFIDTHFHEDLRIDRLAASAHVSPNYFNRLFAEYVGESVRAYQIRRRMEEAERLLADSDLLVKQVAERVGYHDHHYFSRAFRRYYGRWPTTGRAG